MQGSQNPQVPDMLRSKRATTDVRWASPKRITYNRLRTAACVMPFGHAKL